MSLLKTRTEHSNFWRPPSPIATPNFLNLKGEPLFDRFRSDPRYGKLLAQMNLA
jgi:hypothetical protein